MNRILVVHQPHLDFRILLNDNLNINDDNELIIDNKYFKAKVKLDALSVLSLSDVNIVDLNDYLGTIVLFDKYFIDDDELFEIFSHFDKFNEFDCQCGVGFKLSDVANDNDKELELNEKFDKVLADHGFEFIDCSNNDSQQTGGFDRLIDALSTISYPDMIMKDKKNDNRSQFQSIRSENEGNNANENEFDDDFNPIIDDIDSFNEPFDLSSMIDNLNEISSHVRSIDNVEERKHLASKLALSLAATLDGTPIDDEEINNLLESDIDD